MQVSSNFMRRIGACPKCMHESFLAATASWGACSVVGLVGEFSFSSYFPLIAASILAGSLTLLWLLHLAVSATRVASNIGNKRTHRNAPAIASTLLLRRRAFMSRFTAAFVGAALATSLFSKQARAQQWYACGGTSCGGNACCPASQPILNQCDCQCYQSSSDFNNCSSYTQCALDGSNCS